MDERVLQTHASPATDQSSGYSNVTPEIHRDACRRLTWLAVIYSSTYLLVESYAILSMALNRVPGQSWSHHLPSLFPIIGGYLVAAVSRSGKIRPSAFGTVVVAFEILGAYGIVSWGWGWQHNVAAFQEHIIRTGGADPGPFLAKLAAGHIPLFYPEGLTWVCVWILTVPLVLPLNPTRTIVGSFLSAAIVPLVFGGSLLVEGAPESVAWWAPAAVRDTSVPAFICAGLAVLGSRVVYGLTRQLSDARQMGSYRLMERLGVGGMGEVWKAEHRLLARPAAIKLIRREALGGAGHESAQTAIARFEREAQATALLGSPHTIEIYDFGTTRDGTFYYVMELLHGLDLKRLVERYGPVPVNRAVHILAQACDSLADAHASGLIHRDVKPANIFVCRRGLDHDFVKVLDFGLAKETGAVEGNVQLTAEGLTTGTPAFMAPEMVHGPEFDARADLYGLGCVAYWMLTGRLVFEGEKPIQVLLAHLNEPPPPLSKLAAQPVPTRFERVVMSCLEKDPSKRPQSAGALRESLSECLDGLPPWTREQARAWWKERKIAAEMAEV